MSVINPDMLCEPNNFPHVQSEVRQIVNRVREHQLLLRLITVLITVTLITVTVHLFPPVSWDLGETVSAAGH